MSGRPAPVADRGWGASVIMGGVTAAAVRDGAGDPLPHHRSQYGTIVRSSENEKTIQGDLA